MCVSFEITAKGSFHLAVRLCREQLFHPGLASIISSGQISITKSELLYYLSNFVLMTSCSSDFSLPISTVFSKVSNYQPFVL
jgi:hypothetical protein